MGFKVIKLNIWNKFAKFLGQEMVGNYQANFYVINGMVLETRKRREHLSSDDLRKNKALLENFAKGNAEYLEQQNGKHLILLLPNLQKYM